MPPATIPVIAENPAVNQYIPPARLREKLDSMSTEERRAALDARFRPMLKDVARKAITADGTMATYAVWLDPDRHQGQPAASGFAGATDPTIDQEASMHFNEWLSGHDRRIIGDRSHWWVYCLLKGSLLTLWQDAPGNRHPSRLR